MKSKLKQILSKIKNSNKNFYVDIYDVFTNNKIQSKISLKEILYQFSESDPIDYFYSLPYKKIQLDFFYKNGATSQGKQNYRRAEMPSIVLDLQTKEKEDPKLHFSNNNFGLNGSQLVDVMTKAKMYEEIQKQLTELKSEKQKYLQKANKHKEKVSKLKNKLYLLELQSEKKPIISSELQSELISTIPSIVTALKGVSKSGLNAPEENLTEMQKQFISIIKGLNDTLINKLYIVLTGYQSDEIKTDFENDLKNLMVKFNLIK